MKFAYGSKWEWQYPKQNEVIIFDQCGANYIKTLFPGKECTTLALRGEVVNIPCAIHSIINFGLNKDLLIEGYISIFIKKVSPKLIVTFIDNNRRFYLISKKFPEIKTISIQNGIRDDSCELFSNENYINENFVDYMFVFGEAISKKFSKHISGRFYSTGSFKSNLAIRSTKNNFNEVLFISQWRPSEFDKESKMKSGNLNFNNMDFYGAELKVVSFLDNWCYRKNKKLKVCGFTNDKREKLFFSNLISESNWEFIPGNESLDSYKLIDSAELVAFVDSTLGYEAIGRGKKCAAFTCRGVSIGDKSRGFGWPHNFQDNGPFWTNNQSTIEYQRVMDFISNISDEDWSMLLVPYQNEIMCFDAGNSKLCKLINKLLSN